MNVAKELDEPPTADSQDFFFFMRKSSFITQSATNTDSDLLNVHLKNRSSPTTNLRKRPKPTLNVNH